MTCKVEQKTANAQNRQKKCAKLTTNCLANNVPQAGKVFERQDFENECS
jgi:hypothetical protein